MLSRIARQFHLPEEKLRSRLNCAASRSDRDARHAVSGTADDERNDQPRVSRCRLADLPAGIATLLELVLLDPTIVAASRPSAIEPAATCIRLPPGEFTPPAAAWPKMAGRTISAACWPSSTSPT